MHRYLLLLALFFLWAGPVVAQQEQTSDLILELYQEAGPELGSLLFEPDVVLTLSGHKGLSRRLDGVLVEADGPILDRLNAKLKGCRLVGDEGELYVESLVGLESRTGRSDLPWVSPFDAESGWTGFRNWRYELREKDGVHGLAVLSLLYGEPDPAAQAYVDRENDRISANLLIRSDIPYTRILHGEEPYFRLPAGDADHPDVVSTMNRWESELETFYEDPRVKELMRSEEFLAARKSRRPRLYIDDISEKWMRREYDVWGVFHDDSGLTVGKERVLIAQIEPLVRLIRSGETPEKWLEFLYLKNALQGNPALTGNDLRNWIWKGGYDRSPARGRLYQAVKEQAPGYLAALAGRYWKTWLEDESRDAENTHFLLSHPDMKASFKGMEQSQKERVREILLEFDDDVLLRVLRQEPPYKG